MMFLAGLIVSTICAGIAQNPKQANIWYFGAKAGLDFSHGNPVALTNGAMDAYEGCATICDNNGSLLFYTNGGDQPFSGAIWNRRHQVMSNGYLENTAGCSSSMQSSVIVKRPGSENIYYVFTTDCYENSFANGLSYSIVDMSLDGGLGDVVVKGEILVPHTTESLTAALHANEKDYWIITHKVSSDTFFAYQLTNAGIVGVVKSKVGPVADEYVGEIKVSANGQRIAFGGTSFAGIFDFNPSTGVISNYKDLGCPCSTVSFSPNCELLYMVNFLDRKIYQYDMMAYNIKATKTLIGTSTDYLGTMQIGPDNKIYIAVRNSQYIGVITRPNIRGSACNFIKNDIFLNGKLSKYGLPNYPNNVLGECSFYPEENTTKYEPQFLVRDLSLRQITFEINPAPEANGYRMSRRKEGTSRWENFEVESNVITLENLEENTGYEFRMEAILYADHTYEFIYNHGFEQVVNRKGEEESNIFKVATSNGLDFDLYPNPASEKVKMDVYLKKNSEVEIFITDLSGKIVSHQNFEGKSGYQQFELPLADIPNGIYQLSLKCGSLNEYRKLVVVN